MPAARVRNRHRGWRVAVAVPVLVLIVSAAPKSSAASTSVQACPAPATATAPVLPTISSSPSAAEPAPEQILVCVGSESITGVTYSHWLTVARRGEGPASNKGLPPSTAQTRTEALQFLISADWVLGEARDLHIAVSAAQIKRTFDRVKAQQFRTRAQFEAFLRSSGQTVADLLFRVQLNVVSARIQRHVSAVHGGTRARQRALSRFVEAFKAKWMAQTSCAAEYAVQDCGHLQSVL